MSVIITGTVKYARHMKGDNKGKEYEFFSFTVLDNDEGVKWPVQLQADHPQFSQLASHERELMDARVEVTLRAYSAGYRTVKDADGRERKEPQARFYAKDVKVVNAPNMKAAAGASR